MLFLKPLKVKEEMVGLRSKKRQVSSSGQLFNKWIVKVCKGVCLSVCLRESVYESLWEGQWDDVWEDV